MRDKVLCRWHVPPLLDPEKVLDRVEALLEAAGRQEVVHGHGVAEVERDHLGMAKNGPMLQFESVWASPKMAFQGEKKVDEIWGRQWLFAC